MKKIIVIIGPTASGKTALSIELAKQYNGEIINGDSLQVYRTLNIGTAKIMPEEQENIPHHLLDICEVNEPFTASDFKIQASEAIDAIISKGKVPIVVGGTGLYIEGLLYDFHYSGSNSNDVAYRKKLEEQLAQNGSLPLWEQLAQLDPIASQQIHPHHTSRLIRALEVIHATGKPVSSNDVNQRTAVYDAMLVATNMDRGMLYERINRRVDQMVAQGLEAEARLLYERYNDQDIQAARGIGYKEWYPYFAGEYTYEQTIEQIKQHSRRYAKRQLTWFRNRMDVTMWIDMLQLASEMERLIAAVDHFLMS